MAKIIDIKTGKEKKIQTFKCNICECEFTEQEGGLQDGMIGILPVSFCPTCFSGLLDMADYFRGDIEEEKDE